MRSHGRDRRGAVRRRLDLEAVGGQIRREDLDDLRVVVDDQYPARHRAPSAGLVHLAPLPCERRRDGPDSRPAPVTICGAGLLGCRSASARRRRRSRRRPPPRRRRPCRHRLPLQPGAVELTRSVRRVFMLPSIVSACACVMRPSLTAASSAALRASSAELTTLSAATPLDSAISANDLPASRLSRTSSTLEARQLRDDVGQRRAALAHRARRGRAPHPPSPVAGAAVVVAAEAIDIVPSTRPATRAAAAIATTLRLPHRDTSFVSSTPHACSPISSIPTPGEGVVNAVRARS